MVQSRRPTVPIRPHLDMVNDMVKGSVNLCLSLVFPVYTPAGLHGVEQLPCADGAIVCAQCALYY